jgi:hypothetical protein
MRRKHETNALYIRKSCFVLLQLQRRRQVMWYTQDVEEDIVDLYRGESIV